MTQRRTIAQSVTLEGVGLHLGIPCRLTFKPAAGGQGVRFVRTDDFKARCEQRGARSIRRRVVQFPDAVSEPFSRD